MGASEYCVHTLLNETITHMYAFAYIERSRMEVHGYDDGLLVFLATCGADLCWQCMKQYACALETV
jgi:hypothetical protein